jgi:regulator of protease activity HflC (stomatin/prohibitin superfamily)
MQPTREVDYPTLNGIAVLIAMILMLLGTAGLFVAGLAAASAAMLVAAVLLHGVAWLVIAGLFVVNPNEGRVLQLFGDYKGTTRLEGLRWANPLLTKKRISLRVRNFESSRLKVNDLEGNPIEIASVVVWKVVDSAEAVFVVDDYENFVKVQTEAALRNLATRFPYDAHDDHSESLRGATQAVAGHLTKEVQDRLARAGVEVIEARISHLAYAQEIAQAMLQRQQAGAIIAARTRIVEGAVSMVEMALEQLSKRNIVELDSERKAAMVSNLLVVLCGERGTQPVVNTGTLYQ